MEGCLFNLGEFVSHIGYTRQLQTSFHSTIPLMDSKKRYSVAMEKALNICVDKLFSGKDPPAVPELLVVLVEYLLGKYARHEQCFNSVFSCLSLLSSLSTDSLLLEGIDKMGRYYADASPMIRTIIMEALRVHPCPLLVSSLFLSSCERHSTVHPPPAKCLQYTLMYKDGIIEQREMKSMVMGIGTNVHYNLGISSQAEVIRPRIVPMEDVKIVKTSLSSSHSLFLSSDGRVFTSGKCDKKRSGLTREDMASSPHIIPLPKSLEIVDIAAGEGYSLFLSRRSLYICGTNNGGLLGMGGDLGPFPLMKANLPPLGELILDEIVIGDKFTLITTSSLGRFILSGSQFGKHQLKGTFEFYEDYDPEWDNVLSACDQSLEVSTSISPRPHCGIVTGQIASFSYESESYTIRFTLFKGLRYRFIHSTHIGEVQFVIDGTIMPLEVAEFHVNKNGKILVRGSIGTRLKRVYSVYTGQIRLWPKSEDYFECSQQDKKRKDLTHLSVVFILEPIPNSCMCTSLSVSADGENALYVLGGEEYRQSDNVRDWTCMRVLDEPNKEVPYDCKITLGGRSWECMSSILSIRIPDCQSFMNKNIFHVEKIFDSLPHTVQASKTIQLKVTEMIVEYVNNGTMVWNAEVFEPGSPSLAFLSSTLSIMGLEPLGPTPTLGEPRRAVVPVSGSACSVRSNCILLCIDEEGNTEEVYTNRQLLELHSMYFVMAGRYEGRETFTVRSDGRVVRWIVEALCTPASLEQRTHPELLAMLFICDQYGMDCLIDDIIKAFFIQASPSILSDVSQIFNQYFCTEESIVRELTNRPDLVLLWTKADNLSVQIMRRVCHNLSSLYSRRSGLSSSNPLLHGQSIRFTLNGGTVYDDDSFSFSTLQLPNIKEYLLGRGDGDSDRQWENMLKMWYESLAGKAPTPYAPYSNPELLYNSFELDDSEVLVADTEDDDWLRAVMEESMGIGESGREEREQGKRRRRRTDTERRSRRESVREESTVASLSEDVTTIENMITDVDELRIDDKEMENEESGEHREDIEKREKRRSNEESAEQREKKKKKREAVDNKHNNNIREKSLPLQSQSPITVPVSPQQPIIAQSPPVCSPPVSTPPISILQNKTVFPELGGEFSKPSSTPPKKWTPLSRKHFHTIPEPIEEPKESVAPWACLSSPQSHTISLASIQAQESSRPREIKKTRSGENRQNSHGWNSVPSPSTSFSPSAPSSLSSIMADEQRRAAESRRQKRRPLEYVEIEDRAMSELSDLYLQSCGDDVIVTVQRCAVDVQEPIWAQ